MARDCADDRQTERLDIFAATQQRIKIMGEKSQRDSSQQAEADADQRTETVDDGGRRGHDGRLAEDSQGGRLSTQLSEISLTAGRKHRDRSVTESLQAVSGGIVEVNLTDTAGVISGDTERIEIRVRHKRGEFRS